MQFPDSLQSFSNVRGANAEETSPLQESVDGANDTGIVIDNQNQWRLLLFYAVRECCDRLGHTGFVRYGVDRVDVILCHRPCARVPQRHAS